MWAAFQQIDVGQRGLDFSIVLGQTTLIQQPQSLVIYFEKDKRGAGICRLPSLTLDLSSPLLLFGIRQKNGLPDIIWPWSAFYHITLQQLSHSEALNYDHYGRPFPDIPARQYFIGLQWELRWRDTKSFAEWFISYSR